MIVVFEKVAQAMAFLGLKETGEGEAEIQAFFFQSVSTITPCNISPVLRTAAYVSKDAQ